MTDADVLSLITLNTWKCDGDYPRRLTLMARQLRALDPDLVALQEVFVDEASQAGTAATLALALGLESRFEPARYRERPYGDGRGTSWSGMAVLSRLKIDGAERLELPSHPRDGERVAQLLRLRAGQRRLLLINVHLTYLPDEHELRCAQLANVLRHRWLQEPWDGIFLCGDFNDTPDGPLLAWIKSRPDWRVVDCQQAVGGGVPRHSTLKAARVAPGVVPGPNYDFVLLLSRRDSAVELIDAGYVLDTPEDGLYPSDHFGVRVRFRFRGEMSAPPVRNLRPPAISPP